MSSPERAGGGPWPTNDSKCVTAAEGGSEGAGGFDPESVAAEFRAELPHLADEPITREEGRRLRRDLVEEETETWTSEPAGRFEDSVEGETVTTRTPLTVEAAVVDLLESHRDTLQTVLNFEYGCPSDVEYVEWSKEAEDRWTASYQDRAFAQMRGWFRELIGGERPSGGVTEGAMEDPQVVLLTRSASSVPGGSRLSVADHNAALSDAWRPAYDTLRNKLRAAGLTLGEDWQYDRREEPHTGERGGGANRGYGHEHAVLVVDAGKLGEEHLRGDGTVRPSLFRPVVEKHVEACGPAGSVAHDLDVKDWDAPESEADTVVVSRPGDLDAEGEDDAGPVERVTRYVADYCAIEPLDLSERSAEYLAWAATKHATNGRAWSRSDAANAAATADRCRQRAESVESEQTHGHGERVVRSDRQGASLECAACGSPHGIDQSQTLVRARLDASGGEAVADGGREAETREDRLRSRWESARSAAVVGETSGEREVRQHAETHPDASAAAVLGAVGAPPERAYVVEEVRRGVDRGEVVAFDRGPGWRLESVTVDGEEHAASSGGSVEMAAVRFGPDLSEAFESGVRYRCSCGVAAGGGSMARHVESEHGVREIAAARALMSRESFGGDGVERVPVRDPGE